MLKMHHDDRMWGVEAVVYAFVGVATALVLDWTAYERLMQGAAAIFGEYGRAPYLEGSKSRLVVVALTGAWAALAQLADSEPLFWAALGAFAIAHMAAYLKFIRGA